MDAAAKTVKELTQRILPEKPHYLSYSLDWRYHIPANESRQEQAEKLENTRLEYSTFISDADRGVLFTRSYYDMRVEPQQPPLRDVGSLKEGDEKNERSLSDYDLQASLLPTGLSNDNDWKISSPSSDSTSELPSDQKRNIDHAGEKPGSWPNTLGESDGERPGGSHTLHEVVPAVPPTDSEYASAPAMGSEFGRLSKGSDQVATQSTQNPAEQDISDTATEYSEVSTTANSRKQTYVQTQTRISEILPELLKAFALKVGYDGPTQMHRDVMAFVHRHRCDIATALEDIGFKQHQESPKISTAQSDGMDYEERIRRWFVDDSFESGRMSPWWGKPSAELDRIHEESQGLDTNDIGFREDENGLRGPYTGDGDDHITSVKGVAEANNEEVPESWLQAYRDFIPGTEAYQWLVTRLQREFRLVPTEPNTIGSIGGAIMSSLPSAHKISRRISTQRCSARFELQWDIFHFFQTQEYPGLPDEVLEGIITLTGSSLDAQATTCAQYTHQTWPSTGETTLQLIKEVLKDGDGYLSSCKLSDGTTLSAWVDGSKFIAEASGVAVSVMEIGESLPGLELL
ncbi:hypothetical protein CEP52_017103 [Fusarium oligoseptatum]|uniref:Uncharacterized protein n=1 Tax=Fusarium oligoseptatum TaxID=2604345 RepID=A0A428RWE2_9HYPO|nr:hypothetical protein CEP52_017103 [Fusarium oligoseptatum]